VFYSFGVAIASWLWILDSEFHFITNILLLSAQPELMSTYRSSSAKVTTKVLALLALVLIAVLALAPIINAQITPVSILRQDEYVNFVHTYMYTDANATRSNYTIVEKPMFPVYFNDSQIGIGKEWSIVEPLVAGHNYHVYCYGSWVNNGSLPKTDYDIYVFNPRGVQESEHTEAAGLPEHLGTRVNDTFFTPTMTGNYTFVLRNDGRESNGTQQATFMAIENVQTDQWFNSTIAGKLPNDQPQYRTGWAYEFVADSSQIEVYVQVPETLDMYEARLYVMSDQNSLILNKAPLPWEPGLYGNRTGGSANVTTANEVGGYSLDSVEYRGVAYASCEYRGQDMFLRYNKTDSSPSTDANMNTTKTLYHLVLIGEAGNGNLNILVKTRFGDAALTPTQATADLTKVRAGNDTKVTFTSNSTDLTSAVLDYTNDSWLTSKQLQMTVVNNRNCSATIPKQVAGTFVEYNVTAKDNLMNTLNASGSFSVKQLSTLNVTAVHDIIRLGENLTLQGILTGANGSTTVQVQLMSALATNNYEAHTNQDGNFTLNIQFNATDTWAVQAAFAGDKDAYPCFGSQFMVEIQEQPFYVKNGVFLGGGGFFGVVGLALFYYVKKRRSA
jgi:hypothetical protein